MKITAKIQEGKRVWRPRLRQVFGAFKELRWTFKPNGMMRILSEDNVAGGISLSNILIFPSLFFQRHEAIRLLWRWNPETEFFEYKLGIIHRGVERVYNRPDQIVTARPDYDQVHFKIKRLNGRKFEIHLWKSTELEKDIRPIIVKSEFDTYFYSHISPKLKNLSPKRMITEYLFEDFY